MRNACLRSIHDLAKADSRVVFIGSDIRRQNLETFAADYPDRYFMEGIYEAHIVGMAAGMALSGKIPYVNTIATFLTRRCYDQVIIDLGLHNLPVRLLGSGGGTVYAPLGPTHIANEDIAILRAIPNMAIIAPCDAEEMKRAMLQTLAWPGPLYVRIAMGGDKIVSSGTRPFHIGKSIVMREGSDVLFVTTGITTQVAIESAAALEATGVRAAVLHAHTLKPFDRDALLAAAKGKRAVVTVEEHTLMGGLGSIVAEILMEAGVHARFVRLGFPDVFTEELGSQAEIMRKYGLDAAGVAAAARKLL
jgi:transketolase